MSNLSFRDLNLNNPLLNALDELGYSEATSIQEAAFSPIMSGKDLVGIAPTGTGKTFAYLIPLIRLWKFAPKKLTQIIIVVPTRELVFQIVEEFEKLAKYTDMKIAGAHGGGNIKAQMEIIGKGADAVVATPGRMKDLILNRTVPAGNIRKVVFDEVDEMLKLGFRDEIQTLVDLLPEKRQTLMFSATMNGDVDLFTQHSTQVPVKIETEKTGSTAPGILQVAYPAPNINTKINLLVHLLENDKSMERVLVFAGGKRMSDYAFAQLEFLFPEKVAVVHANKNINRRLKTLEDFESGSCRVLVASDLFARGIDVREVSHVINMQVPETPETYVHRIGRTGRADKTGVAITFYSPAEEALLPTIEKLTGKKIEHLGFPAGVEISDQLLPEEEAKPFMKIIQPKIKKTEEKGAAFHEKKDKNKKVPVKLTRSDKMRLKYGKSKTKHGKKD